MTFTYQPSHRTKPFSPALGERADQRWITVDETSHVIRIRNGEIDIVLPTGRHRVKRARFGGRLGGVEDRFVRLSKTPAVSTVPGQEVLTNDGAVVRMTVSAVSRIVDPLTTLRAGDAFAQFYLSVQQAIRQSVGVRTIDEVLSERAGFDDELAADVAPKASMLGIELESVGVRDLVMPGEMKRAVAEVVTARLAGQAALERARGETAALRSLANGARMAADNPAMLTLRLIQQMEQSSGNTFVIGTTGNGIVPVTT